MLDVEVKFVPIGMKTKGPYTSPQVTCDVCGKQIKVGSRAAVHYDHDKPGIIKFAHGHPELCTLTKPINEHFPCTMDLDTFFAFMFHGDHRVRVDWREANRKAALLSHV
jgi:hypothetical protein